GGKEIPGRYRHAKKQASIREYPVSSSGSGLPVRSIWRSKFKNRRHLRKSHRHLFEPEGRVWR
ncbi:MAG: hypothetical protein ACYCX4_17505, partial [Bacillota bacterium]